MNQKIIQTAGRNNLGEFAHYNDDILFVENWNEKDLDTKTKWLLTIAL